MPNLLIKRQHLTVESLIIRLLEGWRRPSFPCSAARYLPNPSTFQTITKSHLHSQLRRAAKRCRLGKNDDRGCHWNTPRRRARQRRGSSAEATKAVHSGRRPNVGEEKENNKKTHKQAPVHLLAALFFVKRLNALNSYCLIGLLGSNQCVCVCVSVCGCHVGGAWLQLLTRLPARY